MGDVKPPPHLSAPAAAWWLSVVEGYALEEHHLRLLTLACEALDRTEQARAIIAQDGPVYRDRFGAPRAHPAVAIERDSRLAFVRRTICRTGHADACGMAAIRTQHTTTAIQQDSAFTALSRSCFMLAPGCVPPI